MPGAYMSTLKMSAKKRNLEFVLTKEELWQLFLKQNKKCALSGVELTFNSRNNKRDGTASLDRIDSSKGYTLDNIQWVHKIVNIMKQDLEEKDFFLWCKTIIENRETITHHIDETCRIGR
jgi:hypothetical protein